mmetsp:Transcript_36433/g.91694  ORF Transcript_36433/g.91694 Transcript_36433/m.91694 type:complete len:289 (-) Transcript_36433:870-1736(-)
MTPHMFLQVAPILSPPDTASQAIASLIQRAYPDDFQGPVDTAEPPLGPTITMALRTHLSGLAARTLFTQRRFDRAPLLEKEACEQRSLGLVQFVHKGDLPTTSKQVLKLYDQLSAPTEMYGWFDNLLITAAEGLNRVTTNTHSNGFFPNLSSTHDLFSQRILSDQSTYTLLMDPSQGAEALTAERTRITMEVQQRVKAVLNRAHILPSKLLWLLCASIGTAPGLTVIPTFTLARFYLIWKIHKATGILVARPIQPACGLLLNGIACWTHSQLNPFVQAHPHVLANAAH